MPLGINDWYLLGIVSKDATGSAYHLFAGMIIIVTSAMAIFIFLVYCITPVSYTHLDVYRRQLLSMYG